MTTTELYQDCLTTTNALEQLLKNAYITVEEMVCHLSNKFKISCQSKVGVLSQPVVI